MSEHDIKRFLIAQEQLPDNFPTHRHHSKFWESLGRVVGTFGFLEEVLGRAIFALSSTRTYEEDEIDSAYEKWLPKLERSLYDQLGGLIDSFGKEVREHPKSTITDIDDLVTDLKEASKLRNVLCHGSWRPPDDSGASEPLFVNRQLEIFDTKVDCAFLNQVQMDAARLACSVINTVTHMGFQFPGSSGPGVEIWKNKKTQ
ncbi:hypothetical protein BMS3Bbin08_00640 [bacterium BMS3Bbin08]|nr:hypothetical protein BMS3Bbin08_00640 [bacterium BMS3Bbin08]HDH51718.1 hypothetical protein [Nitrospirota bacterium]